MKTQTIVRFGDFELDTRERTLTRAGVPLAVSPKAFDLLALLAEQPGKLRTKQDLLDAIWADTGVEEATLGRHISDLRRVLGRDQRYIETVTRHGYRFLAEARPKAPLKVEGAASAGPDVDTNVDAARLEARATKHHRRALSSLAGMVVIGACLLTYGGIR